jgi:hypothetical protein
VVGISNGVPRLKPGSRSTCLGRVKSAWLETHSRTHLRKAERRLLRGLGSCSGHRATPPAELAEAHFLAVTSCLGWANRFLRKWSGGWGAAGDVRGSSRGFRRDGFPRLEAAAVEPQIFGQTNAASSNKATTIGRMQPPLPYALQLGAAQLRSPVRSVSCTSTLPQDLARECRAVVVGLAGIALRSRETVRESVSGTAT